MSSTNPPVPSATRTAILHVVALAGLACGALTGALVARDGKAVTRSLDLDAQPVHASPADDMDGGAATCVLPGVAKPGQKACDV